MRWITFFEVVGIVGLGFLYYFIQWRWNPRRFDKILMRWHEPHAIYLSLFQFLWNLVFICLILMTLILAYEPQFLPPYLSKSTIINLAQKEILINLLLFMFVFNEILLCIYPFFRIYVGERGIFLVRWNRLLPIFYLILWDQIQDYSIQYKDEATKRYIFTLKDLRKKTLFYYSLDVPFIYASSFQKILIYKLNENKWVKEEQERLFHDLSLN